MSRNPFESVRSPVSDPPPRRNLARIVSGPAAAEAMKRLERDQRRRVELDKSSQDFSLTADEQTAVQEAQRFEPLRSSESLRLRTFFGESFVIPPLPKEITPELKEFWEQQGFVLEYWPRVEMLEDKDFPGWKHKPGKKYTRTKSGIEFFDKVRAIQGLSENKNNPNLNNLSPLDLPGAWILKDTRAKPNYKGGKQIYEDDTLFETALGARNNRHPNDFNTPDFWALLAKALKIDSIPGATIRLPRTIEANVMGQGEGFHDTSTYEWCEELRGSGRRLISGGSDGGGASYVDSGGGASDNAGCRPLVVFPDSRV